MTIPKKRCRTCAVIGRIAFTKGGYPVWKWSDTVTADTMSQKVKFVGTKRTLGLVCDQAIHGKELKELSEVL